MPKCSCRENKRNQKKENICLAYSSMQNEPQQESWDVQENFLFKMLIPLPQSYSHLYITSYIVDKLFCVNEFCNFFEDKSN